ncbi:MAG: hypothetical protein JXJ22_10565 [Bacteroidales bacterium]|nr:hypothetical protein [Bacteroidales bacterium]
MKKTMLFILIIFVATIFANAQGSEIFMNDKLEKKWETEKKFDVPESVCYDKERDVIYVANMVGDEARNEKQGFISKLSPDGKILDLKWVTGITSPKGMGIYKNSLFVAELNSVVEIDIEKGEIKRIYRTLNAKFLNDIAVCKGGAVFISDMKGNAIYQIKDGKIQLFIQSDKLNNPNGLFVEKETLLVGLDGKVVKIDIYSKNISDYILNTGGIDGIVPDGKGNYMISDWAGNVYLINPAKEKVKLLGTAAAKINAADIDYVIGKNILYVPTFFDNRVMAYSIK